MSTARTNLENLQLCDYRVKLSWSEESAVITSIFYGHYQSEFEVVLIVIGVIFEEIMSLV